MMWELIVLFALVLPVKARKFLDRLVLAMQNFPSIIHGLCSVYPDA